MATENEELLNKILYAFLDAKKQDKALNFGTVVRAFDPGIEDWQVSFLLEQLEADGHLTDLELHGSGGPYELSPSGRRFIQGGGYRVQRERTERTDRIQIETLRGFKWDRAAVVISLLALVISVTSLVLTLTGRQSMTASSLISKIWNFCHTLRDDGVGYGDYLEQLTYLLFLKMADEYSKPPYNRETMIPKKYRWPTLTAKAGKAICRVYLIAAGGPTAFQTGSNAQCR